MSIFTDALSFSIAGFTVAALLKAILLLLVCLVIMKLANKAILKFLDKSRLDKSLHGFIKSVAKLVMWFVTILIVADSLGIPVTSLLAVFSIAGLAASLAMQDTLSNFASGVLILVTRPFKVGDFIECGGDSGVIKNISLVYTQVLTTDNKLIYLPNSDVSSSRIINYTAEDDRRVDIEITASYDCAIEDVKKALLEAASSVKTAANTPEAPFAAVLDYESSAIKYVLRVWCKTEDYWTTFFATKEAIKKSFDKNNIEMTYDHLNVHIQSK